MSGIANLKRLPLTRILPKGHAVIVAACQGNLCQPTNVYLHLLATVCF